MKNILRYIFSALLLILISSSAYSQEEELNDTIKVPLRFNGIKIGHDIGKYADLLFKEERTAYAGSIDFSLSDIYFICLEGGIVNIEKTYENGDYSADGWYALAGFDKNMLKKYPTDMMGIGLRVGYTNYSHKSENITLTNDHWPNYITSVSDDNLSAMWAEAVISVKGEVFKNFYMGWSAKVKVRFKTDNGDVMKPYHIPGFGKSDKSINLGFTYSLFYKIPFGKKNQR